jgi:hypothetical protein
LRALRAESAAPSEPPRPTAEAAGSRLEVATTVAVTAAAAAVSEAGLDLPLVTGRFTAVTGLTGLDRLRYRPVTNR